MTTDDKIINEKLKHDIKREAAKITESFSGRIDKYKYLAGEEILFSNQKQMLQQAKFRCCLSGKAFEKQTIIKLSNKINELNQIKNLFLQNQLNGFITEKLKEDKQLQKNINKTIQKNIQQKDREYGQIKTVNFTIDQ